ncbi:hypothetical protein WICMUC_005159 [Wickerhamomyces mucosus]|uniref:DNA mismatch repair protein MSH2 n=1 Tax=Wickerhamomyces mucosus TaxID=1378264 RepID=A0A9P8T7E4_9ASCO|nr:hypothetical protein WICMUC_005159 [Wickerhamomyces mucosus]
MSTRPELKFSDNTDERSFYRKFSNLPEKSSQTLRIIDKGEYYSCFTDDARFIANLIFKTTSVLKESNQGVIYLTLSQANLTQLLNELLINSNGYKFEIYDKNLELIKFASPGNIEAIEDLINSSSITQSMVIIALKIQNKSDGKIIGFSCIDTNSKNVIVSEFVDNELYSNLESLLIQVDAKEVLIPSPSSDQDPDYLKLIGVIDRCNCTITEVKSSDFNNKDIEQDLIRLLDNELALSIGDISLNTNGLSSCSAILRYLELLSNEANFGKFQLKEHHLNQFMKLDSSAVRALNIFGTSKNNNTSKNSNLFDLLNHCKSIGGSRLLNQWLKQPLVHIEEIESRQSLVEIMINDTQLRTTLQDELLVSIPDIRKLNKKLLKNTYSNLEDVVRIYQFLIKIPDIIEVLENKYNEIEDEDIKLLIELTWLGPLKELFTPLTKLQELVETTVDLESLDRHQFIIKPDYDEKLQEYRIKLDDLKYTIENIHQEIADELGLDAEKKLKLENHQIHGWCLRLTRTEERAIRGQKKFIELQTVKAGVFFTTSQLRNTSSESLELQKAYNKQQSSLVKEIIAITSTYSPVLEKLSLVLSNLDVIIAFAHVSSYAPVPYTKPKLYSIDDPNGKVELLESRHPCVEMQDDVQFISNDFKLKRDDEEFLIITGPNMGGKSTYIRQLGTISLLAQIGCFIPANEGAELTIFDSILSRVGAGDSQLKGVSTFMVEMLETSSILKSATKNSLIIIDELGRGTSTYDGFGLAWAISEHIAKNLKCFTLFATHFHELTKLSESLPNVSNLHVVAHVEDNQNVTSQDNITLLYKVEPGISDQSFGIHVAEVVKFPNKLISMAKRKAAELEEFNDNLSDEYTKDKKTKCSKEEIVQGSEVLKNILKTWRKTIKENEFNPQDAVESLQKLVKEDFKAEVSSSAYIQEILSTL